ncbi:MAG: aspartate kinase [Oscillospiraceae bacterium]|nr:aspartate kinase [Oscillospiraceae bacterium]
MSTQITVNQSISIVNFNNVPSDYQNTFICEVFEKAADAAINIDMISQAPATSDNISFGFTFPDDDIPKLLSIISQISTSKDRTPMISVGNVKITVKSTDMITGTGFASKVMAAFRELDCLPLLVTTGIDEIGLLVRESEATDLESKLKEAFR